MCHRAWLITALVSGIEYLHICWGPLRGGQENEFEEEMGEEEGEMRIVCFCMGVAGGIWGGCFL